MRLIDADALLNSGFPTIYRTEFNDEVINTDDIRNAPTVLHDNYNMGYQDGVRKVLSERPTGEWKITEAYPHKVYCDNCYKTYAQENWEVWKDGSLPRDFCPNCGAKMKGAEQ